MFCFYWADSIIEALNIRSLKYGSSERHSESNIRKFAEFCRSRFCGENEAARFIFERVSQISIQASQGGREQDSAGKQEQIFLQSDKSPSLDCKGIPMSVQSLLRGTRSKRLDWTGPTATWRTRHRLLGRYPSDVSALKDLCFSQCSPEISHP